MKKRILATVMAMLLVVTSVLTLASCTGGDSTKPTNPQGDLNKEWLDNLGEYNMDGYTVKFAVAETDGDGFNKRSIVAEEDTGDSVDAAVFARNAAISARFNCNIELTFYRTDGPLSSSVVNTALQAGGTEYDVIVGRQYDDVVMCGKGWFVDIAKDERTKDIIAWEDNEYPYWSEGYINGMSYEGRTFWLAGDLALRFVGGYYCTFVNASIYEEKLKDTYGSIYDIVRDKKWTIGMMKTFSDAAASGMDGIAIDTLAGSDAVAGVAMPVWDNTNGWAVSAGVNFCETKKDGTIVYTFNQKNTTLEAYGKAYVDIIGSQGCLDFGGDYASAMTAFASDNALMVPGRLNQAELYLREMSSNYYIIPCPMLNENQENYRSSVHDGVSIFAISNTSENVEYSAVVLEALCAESYRSVRPEYYDNALKFKYTSDAESAEMIDILGNNSYSDFVLVWAFTSYYQGLGGWLRSKLSAKTASLTQGLTKQAMSWESGAKLIDQMFDKLDAAG